MKRLNATMLRKCAAGGDPTRIVLPKYTPAYTDVPAPVDNDPQYGAIIANPAPVQGPHLTEDYDYQYYNSTQKQAIDRAANYIPLGKRISNFATGKIAPVANAVMPFASNIINSFRKPPMPAVPTYNSPVTLSTINMDNERNRVNREINATNASIDRTVDGNTSAAIKLFNQGQKLDKLSDIAQQENTTNTGIRNQQAQINAGIQAQNNAKIDEYNQQKVERAVAQQREQSMNIANAGEKFVSLKNEQAKRKVDLDKTRIMSSIFKNSGVLNRQRVQWKKMGLEDPLGMGYKDVEEKKLGGPLHMKRFQAVHQLRPLKPIPKQ